MPSLPIKLQPVSKNERKPMTVRIATDHGGYGLKEELVAQLRGSARTNSNPTMITPTMSVRWQRPWRPAR